jgi:hypothetical protein
MNPFLANEDLHSDLLDRMMTIGVKGGQFSSGAQKDGFLKYDKGAITAVYDPDKQEYIAIETFAAAANEWMGTMPEGFVPWKNAIRIADKDSHFKAWFGLLKQSNSKSAKLAIAYGKNSDAIGRKLVTDGVANNTDDVNTVMLTGFFHAYGPVNEYFS